MSYDPNVVHAIKPASSAPWVLLFFTLAGAGGGGYWLYQERQRARSEANEAKSKVGAAESTAKELTQKLEKVEAEKAELAAAKVTLSKDVESKSEELAQLKGTHDKLEAQMKDEIAKGDIRLSQSGGKLRVDLVDKILFDSGAAQISKRGEGVLARVGAVLASIEDKQIQVSGHTDKTPISDKLVAHFPTNWELSVARATNVVRFLQERAGVPPQRLVATGYGEHHPIASNKTPSGRARNRRIEILLTPSLAPKLIAKSKLKEAEAQAAAATKEETAEKPEKPTKATAKADRPKVARSKR
jgi:chemotaxis protein MotB